MKRVFAFLLCSVLLLALSVTAFAANDQAVNPSNVTATWHIVGSNVNLRSGAGPEFSSAGYVQNGNTFINGGLYLGTDGNYWRYCSMTSGPHDGENGYVASQYTDFS